MKNRSAASVIFVDILIILTALIVLIALTVSADSLVKLNNSIWFFETQEASVLSFSDYDHNVSHSWDNVINYDDYDDHKISVLMFSAESLQVISDKNSVMMTLFSDLITRAVWNHSFL